MEAVCTIGVYGFDADSFIQALRLVNIDLLIDVRRRRGVRGSAFAFANSLRLQQTLREHEIRYAHVLGLAPDPETRSVQDTIDRNAGVARRKRHGLSPEFVAAYERRTLHPYDWNELDLVVGDALRPALLCVERAPVSCHRSLAAREYALLHGVDVVDITP